MKTIDVGRGRYKVSLEYKQIGDDLLVVIKGGEKEHIGSASLVSKDGEIFCQNIKVANHKDYIISQRAAEELNKKFSKVVLVTCGIHIDDAKRYEIDILVENAIKAIKGVVL